MTDANGVARDQLRAFIERIERLEEEKKTIADDIKDVKAEAKGLGFDVGAINAIIKLRKMDASERAERDAVLDTYLVALGMLPDDGADHHAATGEVFGTAQRLITQAVDGMQTEAGRAALVAAVDIMIEREEAEENSPEPATKSGADTDPGETAAEGICEEVTGGESAASYSEKATVATQGEATAPTSVERGSPGDGGSADANTGGSHVTGSSIPAATTAEGHASAPSAKRSALRPHCLSPGEACGGWGSNHCHTCKLAMKEKELA